VTMHIPVTLGFNKGKHGKVVEKGQLDVKGTSDLESAYKFHTPAFSLSEFKLIALLYC
jgi:hypothetical protein